MKLLRYNITHPGGPGYLSNTTDGRSKSDSGMSKNVACKGISYLLDMQGKRPDIPEIFSLCMQHSSDRWCVVRLGFLIPYLISLQVCNIYGDYSVTHVEMESHVTR